MHRPKIVTGFLFSLLLALTFISLALFALAAPASSDHDQTDRSVTGQDWTNYVRIGAYGLSRNSADQIVRNAQESGVFGIEVDNDIPGRYESFVDPEEKLRAIRAVAEKAHSSTLPERNASRPTRIRRRTRLLKNIPTGCSARSPASPQSSAAAARFGSGKAMKMFGFRPTPASGGKPTWHACGKSPPPELTASTWTSPIG
jgi:hypothetical protein